MEKELEKVINREMFLGEFEFSVDSQCRVSLPSEWRSRTDESDWVLLPVAGKALILLPGGSFYALFEALRTRGFASGALQLALARLGGAARQCRCDRQGRIGLSRKLLDSAGIGNSLLLIGAITHVRLVAPENWQTAVVDAQLDKAMKEIEKLCPADGAIPGLIDGILEL